MSGNDWGALRKGHPGTLTYPVCAFVSPFVKKTQFGLVTPDPSRSYREALVGSSAQSGEFAASSSPRKDIASCTAPLPPATRSPPLPDPTPPLTQHWALHMQNLAEEWPPLPLKVHDNLVTTISFSSGGTQRVSPLERAWGLNASSQQIMGCSDCPVTQVCLNSGEPEEERCTWS